MSQTTPYHLRPVIISENRIDNFDLFEIYLLDKNKDEVSEVKNLILK